MSLSRFFSACLFGHSSDWTRVQVEGVWFRCCTRCLQPTTPILVNAESPEIVATTAPAIRPRHAQLEKKTRTATKGRDAKRAASTVGAKRQKPITLVEKKVS